jgi:NitT/TauT family transport system permease protein
MKRLVNLHPNRRLQLVLAVLPFLIVTLLYALASDARLAENPNDKLLPSLGRIGESIARLAWEEDARSGQVLLWADTAASLGRLVLGVGVSALVGLAFGIANGLVPPVRATLSPFVAVLSMIPPMAVLPILFIAFGLGETSKVVLIVIGIAPFIVRDLEARTLELPAEQLVKAQTLGASTWQIVLRVVLPQVLPRLVNAVRLSLGGAWLFLIAAEAIASTEGLGYRIFLVRRYLAMEVILPYVAWITLLAFLMDLGLRRLNGSLFPWFARQSAGRGGAP